MDTAATKTAAETIKNHHVLCHFESSRSLAAEEIQTIIDYTHQAPSWMNGQHYAIVNITPPELCARIAALRPANPQIASCSTFLTFIADLHRVKLCLETHGGTSAAAGHSDSLITTVTDASLTAQNAVIAAESLGYGTCFIGGIRFIVDDIVGLLQLPEHIFPLFGLCIGVSDIEMRVKPRLFKNTVYAENRYPDDAILSDGLKQYEQIIAEFGETRETLPYHEKFARYYSSAEPKNEPPIYRQGRLVPH